MLRRRKGQALVLVALMLPLLLGMAGAGVTVGTVYYSQAKLQNAVDAAALAGGRALFSQGNASAANGQTAIVTQNDPNANNVSVAVSPSNPNIVVASANVSAPGSFASLFGHPTFLVKAKAAAEVGPGAAFNYAIFQGDTHASDPALTLSGTDTVTSGTNQNNADVHSNNNLNLTGSVNVAGSCGANPTVTLTGKSNCAAGVIQSAPEISMPKWTPREVSPQNATTVGSPTNPVGMTITGSSSSSGNYIVYGNLTIDANSNVTGHYLVEDGNIIIHGNSEVAGSLVTFGGGIRLSGKITQSGGGYLALAAFTKNGTVSPDATAHMTGNSPTPGAIILAGNVTINSAIYAPDSYILATGTDTINGSVVGYRVNLKSHVNVLDNPAANSALPVQQVTLIQ